MKSITLTRIRKCFFVFICFNLLLLFNMSAQKGLISNYKNYSSLLYLKKVKAATKVEVSSPSNGATVGKIVTVKGKVPRKYKYAAVKVDGVWQAQSRSQNFSIKTKPLSEGKHTLKVYAKKGNGRWDNGVTIQVTVSSTTTDNNTTGDDTSDDSSSDTDSTNDANNSVDTGDNTTGSVTPPPVGGASSPSERRVGDPGVTFDSSKFDPRYPEMKEWQKAGVEGGIPFLSQASVTQTITATNTDGIQSAIDKISAAGGGQLLLDNGNYTINKLLKMKNNVRVVGKTQAGVVLKITMSGGSGNAIEFGSYGVQKAGLERLTIIGGHGVPNDFTMSDAKKSFLIHSVYFSGGAKNCWLDKVKILNSGNSAITTWKCKNVTIRDCYIERSWNKGAGGHGYVQLSGSYILFFNNTVKKMRHLAIQRDGAHHNVVYRNNLEQDVNFHDSDAGFNLVEQNVSRLPSGLDSQYHAMMGPWSIQHKPPGKRNACYRNDCKEGNNGGAVTFSDPNKVYVPARHEDKKPFDVNSNTPKGKTFYPVNNVKNDGASPGAGSPDTASGGSCGVTSGPGDIFNDDFSCKDWSSNYDLTDGGDTNTNVVTHMDKGGFNDSSCLRVFVGSGEFYGCDFKKKIGKKEAYAQYKVFYEGSFNNFVGKSPGWSGTYASTAPNPCGWGNCVSTGNNGWSARGSLENILANSSAGPKNKYYVYHADMDPNVDFGDSWYWQGDGVTMDFNKWYTIDMYIKVNTPGQNNGILRAWVNGNLVFNKTDTKFTDTTANGYDKVEAFWFNFYHGGKDQSPQDQYVRIDDFRLSSKPLGGSGGGDKCLGSHCATAKISSPSNGASVKSPFKVKAQIVGGDGYRISVKKKGLGAAWLAGIEANSGEIEVSLPSGSHELEVYGVKQAPDKFTFYTRVENITVKVSGKKDSEYGLTDVKVYPNPSNGILNFDFDINHKINEIQIVDVTGREVLSKKIGRDAKNLILNLNEYSISKGVYVLRVIKNGSFEVMKLVKN